MVLPCRPFHFAWMVHHMVGSGVLMVVFEMVLDGGFGGCLVETGVVELLDLIIIVKCFYNGFYSNFHLIYL